MIAGVGGTLAAFSGHLLPGLISILASVHLAGAGGYAQKEIRDTVMRELIGAQVVAFALMNKDNLRAWDKIKKYRTLLQSFPELYPHILPIALRYLTKLGVNIYGLYSVLGPTYLKRFLRDEEYPTDAPFRETKSGSAKIQTENVKMLEELGNRLTEILDKPYIEIDAHPRINEDMKDVLKRLGLAKKVVPADMPESEIRREIVRLVEEKYGKLAAAYFAQWHGIRYQSLEWPVKVFQDLASLAVSFPWGRAELDKEQLGLGKVATVLKEGKDIREVRRAEAWRNGEAALRELGIR